MITLVAPALDGPATGGTRYNRCLVRALHELHEPCEVLSWDQARDVVGRPQERSLWVDSLWLERLPELVGLASSRCRIGLLTHYLPALVTYGERPPRSCSSEAERSALAVARAFVVPSEYLAGELCELGVDRERVWVIEPGVELPGEPFPPRPRSASEPMRALILANVTEGKGILPLLQALAPALRSDDALALVIVGSTELEPGYAERCVALVAREPALRDRVCFEGSRTHAECMEALLGADVLVSASRMESYGMALAEARACGRPILARAGGNVVAHLDPRRGGELVPNEDALARACVALARNRDELLVRQQQAWAHRPSRAWSWAAEALRSASRNWPPPRPPQ